MTITCEELADLIYAFVEGELADDHHGSFRVHIDGCPNCYLYVESYRHTVRMTKALPRGGPLPEAFAGRLAALLKETQAG